MINGVPYADAVFKDIQFSDFVYPCISLSSRASAGPVKVILQSFRMQPLAATQPYNAVPLAESLNGIGSIACRARIHLADAPDILNLVQRQSRFGAAPRLLFHYTSSLLSLGQELVCRMASGRDIEYNLRDVMMCCQRALLQLVCHPVAGSDWFGIH